MADVERFLDNYIASMNARNESELRAKAAPFLLRDIVQEAETERAKSVLDLAKRKQQLQQGAGEGQAPPEPPPELVPLQAVDANRPEANVASTSIGGVQGFLESIGVNFLNNPQGGDPAQQAATAAPQPAAAGAPNVQPVSPFGGPIVTTQTNRITEPAQQGFMNHIAAVKGALGGKPNFLGFPADPQSTRVVEQTTSTPNVLDARDIAQLSFEAAQTSDMPLGKAVSAFTALNEGRTLEAEKAFNEHPSLKKRLLDTQIAREEQNVLESRAATARQYDEMKTNAVYRAKMEAEMNSVPFEQQIRALIPGLPPVNLPDATIATNTRQMYDENGAVPAQHEFVAKQTADAILNKHGLFTFYNVPRPPEGWSEELKSYLPEGWAEKKVATVQLGFDDIYNLAHGGGEETLMALGAFQQSVDDAGKPMSDANGRPIIEPAYSGINRSMGLWADSYLDTMERFRGAGVNIPPPPTSRNRGAVDQPTEPAPKTLEDTAPPPPATAGDLSTLPPGVLERMSIELSNAYAAASGAEKAAIKARLDAVEAVRSKLPTGFQDIGARVGTAAQGILDIRAKLTEDKRRRLAQLGITTPTVAGQ